MSSPTVAFRLGARTQFIIERLELEIQLLQAPVDGVENQSQEDHGRTNEQQGDRVYQQEAS